MKMDEVKDQVYGNFAIRDLLGASQSHRIAVVKEDMNTNMLADNTDQFKFLVEKVMQGAKVYNKIETSINSDFIKSADPQITSFHLD